MSVPMLPPTTCWAEAQCQLRVNQYQLVSTWRTLQSDKSQLFKRIFEKNGFLAVSGSDLGLKLVTSFLRLVSLSQCIILFALHQFSSSTSHYKLELMKGLLDLSLVLLWTTQDFCSPLTGSDLIFAVSTYEMGKEGQKSSGLSRACLFPVAC